MTAETLTLASPAKLNLFLHITGRRSDGYHNLQTVFQILDRGDSVTLALNHNNQLAMSESLPGVQDSDNLALKAARLLKSRFGPADAGVSIKIDKHLPMGGGLGGGSSNAASTLLGLNRLWQLGLDLDQLAALGLELGADVPVFVHGFSGFAEGIGEKLQPLPLPERWFLVIKPPCEVSTAGIFSHPQLTRDTLAIRIPAAFDPEAGKMADSGADSTENAAGNGSEYCGKSEAGFWPDMPVDNDCESIVRRLYPAVDRALDWLNGYAPGRLTGTGSCIFAAFDTEQQALQVYQSLPDELAGFVAKGVRRSAAHNCQEETGNTHRI